MGSIKFGAGATLGNMAVNGGIRLVIAFLVAGAMRSGINEALEENGESNDNIDFAEGILIYGAKNVTDAFSGISYVLDKIKDNPDKHVQLNVDKHGNLTSIQLASDNPDSMPLRGLS